MNAITLFSANVTEEVPPRLAVGFTPDSGFRIKGSLETLQDFRLDHTQQCRISLGDKTIDFEQAKSLASDHDYGAFFEFKKDSQNTNTYEYKDCKLPAISHIKKDLSQVTLEIRNAKLMVGFATLMPAGVKPAAPTRSSAPPVSFDAIDLNSFLAKPAGVKPAAPTRSSAPPVSSGAIDFNSFFAKPAGVKPAAPTRSSAPPVSSGAIDFNSFFVKPAGVKPAGKRFVPPMPPGDSLSACLKDAQGNFKEGCGLVGIIEQNTYKKYCSNASKYFFHTDLNKKTMYTYFLEKEKAFLALEARKRQADAHRAVDGSLTARGMIEHLEDGDITLYLQVTRLITPNSQNLQAWLAAAPSNNNDYQRLLEAEKAYIRKGN